MPTTIQDVFVGEYIFSGGIIEIDLPKFQTTYQVVLRTGEGRKVAHLSRERLEELFNKHDVWSASVPTGPVGKWLADHIDWGV